MLKAVRIEHTVVNGHGLLKKLFKKTHQMPFINLIGLDFFDQFMRQIQRKLCISLLLRR